MEIPWGYNGLGEIVYLRTYSRWMEKENRGEVWSESIERVIRGTRDLNAQLTTHEEDSLRDHMMSLRGTVSGRALWMLGTKMVDIAHQDALNNCLAGETEVITSEGIFPIKDLAGKNCKVLTSYGRWTTAPIKSFGTQNLYKISLRKGKATKSIRATAEHGWFTRGDYKNRVNTRVTTEQLKINDSLVSVRGQGCLNTRPSPFGIAHGIVYGDGSNQNYPSPVSLSLFGSKGNELIKFFSASHMTKIETPNKVLGVRVSDLPRSFKLLPDWGESKSFLYGWLAGYFAADGHISEKGQASIASASLDNIKFVRNLCAKLAIPTNNIVTQLRKGYGVEEAPLYRIGLEINCLSESFFIINNHRERFLRNVKSHVSRDWKVTGIENLGIKEEVFCAVVPETHAFALADNILTSNCYFSSVTKADDFRWIMDRLMVGGGVGFSVERTDAYQLPTVQKTVIIHERTADADHIVSDTRKGWSTLIDHVIKAHFKGEDFTYSTLLVRGYGAPLKTFGGTASGPQALIDGVTDICKVMCTRSGKRLRSVDVLDIVNIIGRIVVAGSSRRSAQISLGDQDDTLFLKAKKWSDGNVPAWRANSNNTVIVDNFSEIADNTLFWNNFNGGSEAYGLFNRKLSRAVGRTKEKRVDNTIVGGNPCLEVTLGNKESCNLATIWLPNIRTFDEFIDLSSILYKIQKATALLPHPSKESEAIIHKNLRLGQSVAGILQATDEQRAWLSPAYESLRALDSSWSKHLGVRESVRLTAIQPNGTLGLVGGTTPGIHPAYDRFYIRRVRFGSNDPLVEACRNKGYPVVPEIGLDGAVDHTRFVVEFPCEAPENTPLASEMTAEQQLEWVAWAQENFADNAVSVTVTYKDEELPSIKKWLTNNYDTKIKSVSFLRYSDHGFKLAPYEPIDKSEYEKRVKSISKEEIILKGVSELDDDGCETGACPVR